ncbi:rho GTPase-activating protein 190 isoform X4 [Haemaphysalis longicornis]
MTSRRQPGGPPVPASEASPRSLCVAVVGLSGTERDKGPTGVGKSCLCNRFVRPRADDYHTDHISVLSQTDFGGRVVNNDHFLYWGEARPDDEQLSFHVVEQTEFIDDSSFQPFRSGKTEPYLKRCAALRLCSAEKLMYVCKSQLGIEKEFEQRLLPDGRLTVDGFVCVYDVSHVPGRPADKQAEFVAALLQALVRTRKPVVLAATKADEACEAHLREAERLVSRKELRGQVPLVETSAHENVNVELAFLLVAQLVDRGGKGGRWPGAARVPSFLEASRARREALDQATDAFQALVRSQVTDPRAQWGGWSQRLLGSPECERFCALFGRAAARVAFEKHVRRLREEHAARRVRGFLRALPTALAQLLPSRDALGDSDWATVKEEVLRPHADFEQYFVEGSGDESCGGGCTEDEEDDDGRIPFGLLERPEAEACFLEHRAALEAEERRQELRAQFRQLLDETGYVTPGKSLGEVRVLFMGRECYEQLAEADLLEVYEEHQAEMTERARCQFQELLLEHAELFYEFANVGPGSVITQEDIGKITEALQEDARYKTLDRLDQERMLMLLRHLGFVHGPMREHCPAQPDCMDGVIEQLLHRRGAGTNGGGVLGANGRLLHLVVLGAGGSAQQVAQAMRQAHPQGFRLDDKAQYALDFRIIDGDVGLPHNSFRTEPLPHGCLCVYASQPGLEYIRESLEKTLLANLEQEDRLPFHGLPLVMVFAGQGDFLREEGINRAKSLQCPFVDVGGGLDPVRLEQALCALVESIERRAGRLHIYQALPAAAGPRPDLRLMLCMLCGDPYAPEQVLAPLLAQPGCLATGPPHCLSLDSFLGSSKRCVQVRLASYHEASAAHRAEQPLLHGLVLVYSAQRRASLATLGAFAKGLPPVLPLQVVAVTAEAAASAFFSSELAQQLLREGNALADRLQAHFATAAAPPGQAFYQAFFKEAWERKPLVERAFFRDDSEDEDEEGDEEEESPEGPPVPSRQESYHLTGGHLDDGAEGLYEQLPSGSSSSPPGRASLSSDNEAPPENGTDHLVRPSQLRKRRSLQAELYRQQPSSDSLEGRGPTLVTFGGGGGVVPPPAVPVEPAPPPPRLCTTGRRPREAPPPPCFPTAGLRKSSSLKASYGLGIGGRAAPVVPPVVPAEEPPDTTDSITDDDDTSGLSGWVEARSFGYPGRPEEWAGPDLFYHRPKQAPPIKPKPKGVPPQQQQQQPGKLNLRQFDHLTEAISRLQMAQGGHKPPLALPDEEPSSQEAAFVDRTAYTLLPVEGGKHRVRSSLARRHASRDKVVGVESDSDSEWSSLERHPNRPPGAARRPLAPHRRGRHRRHRGGSIPVAPPRIPALPPYPDVPAAAAQYDQQVLPCTLAVDDGAAYELAARGKEKGGTRKKDERKKAREDEKLEKRRLKEEERQKRLTEKKKKKSTLPPQQQQQPGGGGGLEEFAQSETVLTPLFVEQCVRFIEHEGLDSEGLYRVPGNRAHVELLLQRLDEGRPLDLSDLELPVNAVATALKDFFSKRLPPLLSHAHMGRLTDIAGLPDRSCRLLALRELVKSLPPANFEILKFIFQHFVRVAENCRLNSMDSKNLAICWWPTLLPLEFSDMGVFERVRPHLEDAVQTMIDQFRFLFCDQDEVLSV